MSIADVLARVFITAAIITIAVPVLFFLVISDIETRLVVDTMKRYIGERCTLLRPWVPEAAKSGAFISLEAINNASNTYHVETTNKALRLLAFKSTLIASTIMLCIGFGVWVFFGSASVYEILGKSFFYVIVFCITEVVFVTLLTKAPILDYSNVDLIFIEKLVDVGRQCVTRVAPDVVNNVTFD
jgi:hypothetical protein